jgi:general secretion pathway protein K
MTVVSRQSSVFSHQFSVLSRQYISKTENCKLKTDDYQLMTENGVILIAVLWIFVALAVIALSFSKESFVEVAAARNSQSLEISYYAARAGLMTTIYQIIQKRTTTSVLQPTDQDTPDPIDLGSVTGNFGGAAYRVDIQDDSGRIALNLVGEEQLRSLTEVIGIPQNDADIIVDSILDWHDADTNPRANGAEDAYYQSLNPPYKAKNKNFDTLEELLLVRGITPDYFYGHPERSSDGSITTRYGLSRYLSVYSSRNQVNVNYAPLAVLQSIPGMPPEAAQLIYNRRLTKPFKTLQEITRDLSVTLDAKPMSLLSTDPTGTYILTASARAENSRVRRVLRAVVNCPDNSSETRYRTLYWNENVSDYEGVTP